MNSDPDIFRAAKLLIDQHGNKPLADGSKVLALRHPGFGSIEYVMEPERAAAPTQAMGEKKAA